MTLSGAPQTPPQGQNDLVVGSVIGERYRILERIGEGGMGAVYKAEHTLMKKVLAVKLLHPELGRLDEVAKRFEREAQSASRLNHEHIIQVTDFGRTATGALFLVMEFLQGESLAAAIKRSGRLPVARAVGIARQILGALEHAHAEGVVHRDLKPENIMLVLRGTMPPVDWVKILDFGIAKLSDDAPTGGSQPLTQAGVVFGTPDYMSPEQAMGEATDGRADLYACGIILYEMLTGQKPFQGKSHVETISMHLTREPPPIRSLAPEVPPAVEEIVRRAMKKKRDERFKSATEFLAALETAATATSQPGLSIDSVRIRVRSAVDRLPTPARRLLPAAALVVIAFVFAAFTLLRGHKGPASTPPPPKPVQPAVAQYTKLAEEALSRGELVKARTILTEQLSEHPEAARVHYLLGNIDFIERKPEAGMDAYREAIKRDPGYRGDAALLRNLRLLLDDKRLAAEALDVLIKDVGKPAGAALAEVASDDKRIELRHAALRACGDLGCEDRVDRVQSYSLDLQQGKTCEDRREAVARLKKLGDKRALEPLRKARRRGGGLFGLLSGGNDCIKKDLDEAIKALESS